MTACDVVVVVGGVWTTVGRVSVDMELDLVRVCGGDVLRLAFAASKSRVDCCVLGSILLREKKYIGG